MKICVQSGGIVEHIGAEKCYHLIKKAGFESIDWQAIEHALGMNYSQLSNGEWKKGCIYDKPLHECIDYFAEEYEIIQKHGLAISQTHAPFPCWLPEQPDLLDYMIGVYKRVIEVCQHYHVSRVVIHGIARSLNDSDITQEEIDALNWHLYNSLIPTLQACPDVVICLENSFTWDGGFISGHCTNEYEAIHFIDTLNESTGRTAFGLCFDTGHMNLMRKDFRNYIHALGHRIVALHIHDNDGNDDRHMIPFSGKIRWDHFCSSLKDIGYTGDLSFETFAQAQAVLFFDEELLLPWLTVMAETGKCLRKHILN